MLEASWTALRQLGAPPDADDLQPALASGDAAVRAAATRALLAADGSDALARVGHMALADPSPDVRVAAAEALGQTRLAAAHPPPRAGTRELLRIQGHRGAVAAPSTATPLVLAALGADHPFAASDLRTFGFADVSPPEPPPGTRFTLQGSRDLLVRFAGCGRTRPSPSSPSIAPDRPICSS